MTEVRRKTDAHGMHQAWSEVLVGRDIELEQLLAVAEHPPSIVLVEGEAGIGKSRLVQEVLDHDRVRHLSRLVGHCYSLREPFPLGPVLEAIRSSPLDTSRLKLSPNAGALRPLLPELEERLPEEPKPLGDRAAERHRVFRALVEVLQALGGALLVLEDLHWADGGTLDFLTFLVSNQPEQLSLVLTYRTEDDSELGASIRGLLRSRGRGQDGRVQLGPLSTPDVARLVSAILDVEEVSEEFAALLRERTSGVPFAVEEVVGLLQNRRDLFQRDGTWVRRELAELSVPGAVRDAVLERIARLSTDGVAVLRAIAVLAEPADQNVLTRLARLPAARVSTALSEALASGALVEGKRGGAEYRHLLARQSVYEAIPGPERRDLHLRAAKTLQAGRQHNPAQLAHHYMEAGRGREGARWAEVAADHLAALGDDADAFWFLRRALDVPDLPRTARARMAVKLGTAALHGLAQGKAIGVLKDVLGGDELPPGTRGELRLALGWLLLQGGEAHESFEEIRLAVGELRARPGLAARAMATLAMPWVAEGSAEEHVGWMDRALRSAARQDDPLVNTAVRIDRAYLLLTLGDPDGWKAIDDIPTDTSGTEVRRQLARCSRNLTIASLHLGYFERARDYLEEGRRRSDEISYERHVAALDSAETLVDWLTGRSGDAQVRAPSAEARAEDPGAWPEVSLTVGLARLAAGEPREAEEHLAASLNDAQSNGDFPLACLAQAEMVRLYLAEGRLDEAAAGVTNALEVVRSKGAWVWSRELLPGAVEVLQREGRQTEASRLVEEAAAGLTGRDAPWAEAALALSRAMVLSKSSEADQEFDRAYGLWSRMPYPHRAAVTIERRAARLLETGQEGGIELLRQALLDFQSLGASWDAARVRQALRELGVVVPYRGGRRGYGEELSPREREVAVLAAAGRTNREIASKLFLSPRTVEDHVGRAMRKLGIASREDLAAAVEAPEEASLNP